MRIIVGMTGASGAPYGVRMLEILRDNPAVETHLVISRAAALTIRHECGLDARAVEELADVVHKPSAIGATIASGSSPCMRCSLRRARSRRCRRSPAVTRTT